VGRVLTRRELIAWLGASGIHAASPRQQDVTVLKREGLARDVYATAVDGKGTPVRDLAPSEVSVKVDGASREVFAIAPATAPMHLALLIDDTGPGLQDIREGAAAFVRSLRDKAEIALVSTGGRNTLLVDFTSRVDLLISGINRLTTRTTSGGYLLDGIQETSRVLEERAALRPVVVVVALEGTEYSTVSTERVLEALRRSGAVLHVLSIGKPSLKTMTPFSQRPTQSIHENLDETISRGTVLAEGPRRTGGRLEQVVEFTGIPARLLEISEELSNQVVITYARPVSAKPVRKIDVSVKRRGVKLRAPTQLPDR
jgi:VWFA-related protein